MQDVFTFLCLRTSYQRKSTGVFHGPVWTWEISPKKERVLLTNFRKSSNGYFLNKLYKHTSKLKYFPSPLDITQFRNTNDFLLHVVCYEGWACQLLKVSMSQKVKKGPFAALIIESSLKVSWKYFQKPMWLYLLTTTDTLMDKVWGKTFFQCEMSWTAFTEIAT